MKGVLQYPNAYLREVSVPYENGVLPSREIIDDMKEYQGKGLGLAAIQLGVAVCLIMIKYGVDYLFMVNPEIVKVSTQTWTFPEGCLSIKDGKELHEIVRPKRVKVRYTSLDGGCQSTLKLQGLTGRSLLHEVDHLDGKLIIDF